MKRLSDEELAEVSRIVEISMLANLTETGCSASILQKLVVEVEAQKRAIRIFRAALAVFADRYPEAGKWLKKCLKEEADNVRLAVDSEEPKAGGNGAGTVGTGTGCEG